MDTETIRLTKATIPERPALEGLELKWSHNWRVEKTYEFIRPESREEVFSIDTPPPTVSGSLHVGHVFSYTHTDLIARYQRMQGKRVFYAMGWDDNGLPTERRVQNYYGVRCEPSIAYDPAFQPSNTQTSGLTSISRRNFVELCHELTRIDEQAFEDLWRRLGLSVDWSLLYETISPASQRVAQLAFLRNVRRGEAYLSEAPTLWDTTFATAVAQAELEAREYPGNYYGLAFRSVDGCDVVVETTRPELLPACCALIAHPDDDRFQALIGTEVETPVFGVTIPVLAHSAAEPAKGTGIAMCCTFGDLADVTWWRELKLPTRTIIGRDGRIQSEVPAWIEDSEAFARISGRFPHSAREEMVSMLRQVGRLVGEPRPTMRMANFYEKGDRPLEIVSSRQWYLSNGGNDSALRSQLLARGEQLEWTPKHMQHRYANWVTGLNGDWLISRQRFFGVPFPAWYPLGSDGSPQYESPIFADEHYLPVDPAEQPPPGFEESARGIPGGFIGDPDVMDTWATSSLTPQIACGWERDSELWRLTFPMDLAPQAHDIIRTWLFSRVLRSHLENDCVPWSKVAISGFVTDPDRKKMSKSKGNVVVPTEILDTFGADAVRWRAAMARPGADSPFDRAQMRVGRRLAMKILHASRFVLSLSTDTPSEPEKWVPVDLAMLAQLRIVVETATNSFDSLDYTSALEITEQFFWTFCDDYLELVKERAYGGQGRDAGTSARFALMIAVEVLLKLFAPFLPFVTEEVWSWGWCGSVHNARWPKLVDLPEGGDADLMKAISAVLSSIRAAKSTAQLSMKSPIDELRIAGNPESLAGLATAELDLRAAAHLAGPIVWMSGEQLAIVTSL